MNYYQLQPMLMTCDFNYEMIMSVVTPYGTNNRIEIQGNFRTRNDFGGMIWTSEDRWSHPNFKYATNKNFSGVKLSYNYKIEGYIPRLDDINGQSLTVTNADGTHMVRVWNYAPYRPLQDWEAASGLTFPRGRTPGDQSGEEGIIEIDFDNLYAGWQEYEWVFDGYDEQGNPIGHWEKSSKWHKIDPTTIERLMWGFTPITFDYGEKYPLSDSQSFKVTLSNWTVEGARNLGTTIPFKKHIYRLADGFDDSYAATPERYINLFYELGFRKWIDLYIGASHYYDKKGLFDASGNPIPDPTGYVLYRYIQKTTPVLNEGFKAWFIDFCKRAEEKKYVVVGSISLETVDAPETWWQRAYDGTPATSGWIPTPHFVSFTNNEVKEYYKNYAKAIADIQFNSGLKVCIQLGEPWWWNQGIKPCFYDTSTKQKFWQEMGYDLPIYNSMWQQKYDKNALQWLRQQNGKFLEMIRDYIRSLYPEALITVLFFPPTVIDLNRVGEMMKDANFPSEYWKNKDETKNLNFFQIEDYDWIIDDDAHHKFVYKFTWENLKYQSYRTHYFAGFVLNSMPIESDLWQRINTALIDGVNNEFESYIWAGTQIRRDGWIPPDLVWKTKELKVKNLLS
ncbi:MAG: hypothetical protein N3F66_14360 [Spirochaetes bacterium]|nr:hypothetical protein [Spirochaetota bacterium]